MKKLPTLLIAAAIIAVCVFGYTQVRSGWVFVGLLTLGVVQRSISFETICPHCQSKFLAITAKTSEKLEQFDFTSAAIAIAICVAAGAVICYAQSGWAILILLFLGIIEKPAVIEAACPNCGAYVQAVPVPIPEPDED